MELLGSVLNVVDFGAFVDIGLHDSGLVHISQLSARYVRDPHDVVSVGEIVPVWVLELDKARRRVALTMISPAERERQRQAKERKESGKARAAEARAAKARAAEAAQAKAPPPVREQRPAAAGGAGGEPRPRPARPSGDRGPQRARPSREQGPRTYVASGPSGPPKPLTKAMQTGKEPLRTFGDLKQFFESKSAEEPPAEPPAEGTA